LDILIQNPTPTENFQVSNSNVRKKLLAIKTAALESSLTTLWVTSAPGFFFTNDVSPENALKWIQKYNSFITIIRDAQTLQTQGLIVPHSMINWLWQVFNERHTIESADALNQVLNGTYNHPLFLFSDNIDSTMMNLSLLYPSKIKYVDVGLANGQSKTEIIAKFFSRIDSLIPTSVGFKTSLAVNRLVFPVVFVLLLALFLFFSK